SAMPAATRSGTPPGPARAPKRRRRSVPSSISSSSMRCCAKAQCRSASSNGGSANGPRRAPELGLKGDNMRYLIALALGVSGVALHAPVAAQTAPAAASAEDARFETFGERIVDEYLKLNPVYATTLGEHRYDAQMPDVSAK